MVALGIATTPRRWTRFVALGDSYTEGLMDAVYPDGSFAGWADRVAAVLAQRGPGLQYANLAIRGRKAPQVLAEQVPAAVALQPDLASFGAGVNDVMRRSFDLNATATALEQSVRALRATGSDVLLWCFGDPARTSTVMGRVADRIDALGRATRAIAAEYGCYLGDFWRVAVLDDTRLWDADRLHLNSRGHEVAAAAALEALGLGDDRWRTPMASAPPGRLHRRAASHAHWAAVHLGPWVVRRARGVSSGDGIEPKRPTWGPPPTPPSTSSGAVHRAAPEQ